MKFRTYLAGKCYTICEHLFSRPRGSKRTVGDCTPPHQPHRKIRIDPRQSERAYMDTVIHECLHALDWSKDEEWVADASRDLTHVLYDRMGYRRGK